MPRNKSDHRPRLTHGTHSYLITGRLPKGGSYITRAMRGFRQSLEKSVAEAHGTVSLQHAAIIQTVIRHETVAQLAQRWLRLRFDALADSDRLNYARQIAASSDARDKAIRSLGLDRANTSQIIDVLYDSPIEPPALSTDDTAPTPTETADNGR